MRACAWRTRCTRACLWGNMDMNMVNGSVECEDYAVNESNMDVDHVVSRENVHVIDEDNADMNKSMWRKYFLK